MTNPLNSHAARIATPRPISNAWVKPSPQKTAKKTEQFSKEFQQYLNKSSRKGDLGDNCECHCCWWWK